MASVSYSDLHNDLNLTTSDITAVLTENLLDRAIDYLNLAGKGRLSVSNMAGVAGSKTVTLTSPQRAAVLLIAGELYRRRYLNPSGAIASGIGIQPSTEWSDMNFRMFVNDCADNLQTRTILRC